MNCRVKTLPWILAAALLGACAGDDIGAYKRGLKVEDKQAAESTGEAEGANPYRIEDLSPAHKPSPTSDEAGLWLVMEKAERRVRTAGNRFRNEQVNDYVNKVTCRVTAQFCKDIRVYLIRAPRFNASMAPNGMMHIRTGLLLRVENEAQLAAVIGHEAGHYLRRHSLQQMREVIEQSNSLMFFRLAMAAAGVAPVGDIAMLMTMAGLSSYSRNHEREADGYGLLLLSRAGYDPEEVWKVWEQLVREKEADKEHEEPLFFVATHPNSEERMAQLKTLAKVVRTEKTTDIGRERLRDIVLPIRAQLLRDELHLRKYGPFEVLVDELIERGDNLAELYYFKGEMHRLRNKEDDLQKALEFYGRAREASGTAPAGLFRSMGLVHLKLGQKDEARFAFREYVDKNPQARDLDMIKHLIGEAGT